MPREFSHRDLQVHLQLLKEYPGRVYRCADHQIVDVTDEYMPRQRTIEIDLNIDN